MRLVFSSRVSETAMIPCLYFMNMSGKADKLSMYGVDDRQLY